MTCATDVILARDVSYYLSERRCYRWMWRVLTRFSRDVSMEDFWDEYNYAGLLLFIAGSAGIPTAEMIRVAMRCVAETTEPHFACEHVDRMRDSLSGFVAGSTSKTVVHDAMLGAIDAYFGDEAMYENPDRWTENLGKLQYVRVFTSLCMVAQAVDPNDDYNGAGEFFSVMNDAAEYAKRRDRESRISLSHRAAKLAVIVRRELPWELVERAMRSAMERDGFNGFNGRTK